MSVHYKVVRDIEYELDAVINGKRVIAPAAFITIDEWFLHLDELGHVKIDKALASLREHRPNGLTYRNLSRYLYVKLLDKIVEWNELCGQQSEVSSQA